MLYLNLIVDGSRKQLVAGVIESHRGDLVGVVDGVGRASLPYVPHLVFGGRKGLTEIFHIQSLMQACLCKRTRLGNVPLTMKYWSFQQSVYTISANL